MKLVKDLQKTSINQSGVTDKEAEDKVIGKKAKYSFKSGANITI